MTEPTNKSLYARESKAQIEALYFDYNWPIHKIVKHLSERNVTDRTCHNIIKKRLDAEAVSKAVSGRREIDVPRWNCRIEKKKFPICLGGGTELRGCHYRDKCEAVK